HERELDQRRSTLVSVRSVTGEPGTHASEYIRPASALCLEIVSYFTAPTVGISATRAHARASDSCTRQRGEGNSRYDGGANSHGASRSSAWHPLQQHGG